MDIERICSDIFKIFDGLNTQNIITPKMASLAVPKREKWVHKGSCGNLLICGGSIGLTGAPSLSAMAALRSGAGLVTLACARELNPIFEQKLTEVMTLPVAGKNGVITYRAKKAILEKMKKSTALLIGPGLSQTKDTQKLVRDIIGESDIPLVLDADALNVISKTPDVLKSAKCPIVITPHIGEFARLTSLTADDVLNDAETLAAKFSKEYGTVTVLKSHRTVVATPGGETFVNILGNPGMASGGTGDVLAGIVASFLAQGTEASLAALGGVYFHSFSGDIAEKIKGEYSLIASDIINYLGDAIKATQNKIN